ncbi:MAG: helicase, partial [Brevibacterium aurantiacum]
SPPGLATFDVTCSYSRPLHIGTGMHGSTTLHVTSDLATVPARLRSALDGVVADAEHQGLTMTARTAAVEQARAEFIPTDTELWDGTIVRDDDGAFAQVVGGRRDPLRVSKKNETELTNLLALRDGVTRLLDLESQSTVDGDEIRATRADLRAGYESYVRRYGPINRFTVTKTGARLTPEAPRLMKADPFGPAVLALELFDDETQTSKPAARLERRVVAPRPIKEGAETPAEAVALSMDRHGYADIETIAYLLGTTEQDAREQLGTLVFDDPDQDGQIVPAAEYLSGNVREKFDHARTAADDDPERYGPNVVALQEVIPETIGSDQIEARIGAVWIDAATHQAFFRDVLRDRSFRVESPLPGEWVVKGDKHSLLATEEYGTNARPAPEIAAALLEQRPVEVRVEIEVGDSKRRVIDAQETTAAQEKADKLQERFGDWVWEDAERAQRLVDEYNRRFNAIVLRDYTNDGQYLTLPGLTESFSPRPHQRAAVARIVSEPAVGLFHQVGAGKTAEMVMGAMELRRMGLASKPAVVVCVRLDNVHGLPGREIASPARPC